MNVDGMIDVLAEYRPSMKLKVMNNGTFVFETCVVDMMTRLMAMQRPEYPTKLALFGRFDFILREKQDSSGGDAIIPPWKQWLEIDAR